MENKKKMGIGVGVIVLNEKNQLLLGLRNDDPEMADSELHLEGTWTMPRGKLEFGESFEEAGIRETKEETNLDVEDVEVICFANDKNQYAQFVTVGMIAKKYSGEVKTMEPDEIVDWKWFDVDNLPKNLYFPSEKVWKNYLANKFYDKNL